MSRKRGTFELPKHVHRVTSRCREYFYYHPGRGTKQPGERVRLPSNPQSPEFWQAIRVVQGETFGPIGPVATDTVSAMIDAYLTSPAFLGITVGSQKLYRRELHVAMDAWGDLPVSGLRPSHVRAMMERLADRPGKANNFLGTMRTLSDWARSHDHADRSITEGVKPYKKKGGHKPWTPEQIQCVHERLAGPLRRAVLLALYTGQRGSDIVRMGWTDVDEGGFSLRQQKTGRDIWCPIVPELAAEMATWEKRPGPFVTQEDGKVYARNLLTHHFQDARQALGPVMKDATLHGLRSTAVVRLRRAGLTTGQIGDIIGMSLPMIERYCRFADRKSSGQAALLHMNRNAAARQIVKRPKL
jgi:integrase